MNRRSRWRFCRPATSIATTPSKSWKPRGCAGASPASATASAACRRRPSPTWRSRFSAAARWSAACARSEPRKACRRCRRSICCCTNHKTRHLGQPARCTNISRIISIWTMNCCWRGSCRCGPTDIATPAASRPGTKMGPRPRSFERSGDAQDQGLVEPGRDNLKSDREPAAIEPAGNRRSRQPGQIYRPRERRPA